jgi:DNA-3-methyladenine glycosylase II
MFLHEIPEIAAGLDYLIVTVPHFAGADRNLFEWQRREAGFGGLLRMILGQQVSTRAADAMWNKLAVMMPEPEPARFLTLDDAALSSAGFSRQKMRYGRAIAETLIADPFHLDRIAESPDEAAIATLTALPGIGRWSAEVYLMFCLGRPDVWPAGDLGIILGLQYMLGLEHKPPAAEIVALGEPWRPNRSAASLLVWNHYTRVAVDRRREQRGREQAGAAMGSKGEDIVGRAISGRPAVPTKTS